MKAKEYVLVDMDDYPFSWGIRVFENVIPYDDLEFAMESLEAEQIIGEMKKWYVKFVVRKQQKKIYLLTCVICVTKNKEKMNTTKAYMFIGMMLQLITIFILIKKF